MRRPVAVEVVPQVSGIEFESINAVFVTQDIQMRQQPLACLGIGYIKKGTEAIPPLPHDHLPLRPGQQHAECPQFLKPITVRADLRDKPEHYAKAFGMQLLHHVSPDPENGRHRTSSPRNRQTSGHRS